MKRPAYYALTKKEDILNWIFDNVYSRHDDYPHPLCINVKCHNLDLSFGNLCNYFEGLNANWLNKAYERYSNGGDHYEIAIEHARNLITETDSFKTTWNKDVKVKYEFVGRSGGWLSICSFEGYNFNDGCHLKDLPYPVLVKLYKLIIILKHDLKNPSWYVERNYANALFGEF